VAGGIDWFRWHHGSVTDPKFGLIAKRAGARIGDVIALWAFLLETASSDADRGTIGELDFESIEHLLGLESGDVARILDAMTARGLITGSRIASWEKRQPKREDDTANERKRRQREREHELALSAGHAESRDVTQGHADVTHGHARGEERREEKKENTPPGFALFWASWPKSDRKQSQGKCLAAWKKAGAESNTAQIVAHVESMKAGPWRKDDGQYIPAPLTYLNQRRWEGAEHAVDNDPYGLKKAINYAG
jgi:hypothetical protein